MLVGVNHDEIITLKQQGAVSLSGQMDLLVEQVKMLAGEISLSMSTLKRMIEQSVNDHENSKTHSEDQCRDQI
ncbi:hypothetical protein P3S68_007751 [Capsicum galapagoense]